MTVKMITHPATGKTFCFGRVKPRALPPMLRLKNYLLGTLPPPPPARADWAAPAIKGLELPLGNDELGDCTCAGAGHIEDIFRVDSKSGLPAITREQAIALYSAACGYIPGDTNTDNGGTLTEVLSYWKQHGILGQGVGELAGWLAVDATNQTEVEQAIYLFGNLYIGLELPDAWIRPFPSASGFVWGVAGPPDPANGHCVCVYGYNAQGVFIDSWGMFGTITWPAFSKYLSTAGGGEVYAILSDDWIDAVTGLAPSGFSFAALQADLAALA
jgi:hypothetical protein